MTPEPTLRPASERAPTTLRLTWAHPTARLKHDAQGWPFPRQARTTLSPAVHRIHNCPFPTIALAGFGHIKTKP